ncbi:LysE family translocator [Neobacillus sp. MM2021_6]|uniref:LysE family translocator n=1 Tax=Bacillaceae TaxID=186817 RepID=UPI00140E30C2|nr:MULTISPECIES: LysE family translocator [Bacillaceae]MBO0962410.1 LysE family translocator [Neobacillus sp. MM2021_6]NHC21021.1 LysE family translocator [Bacillus sp. MM2020_4]WML39158.1 LysE family translocator [Neobacillus sp. OS1-2]
MQHFYLFILMCILLIILPGPDTAMTTKNTLTVGRSGGMKTLFGTCCALLIHTFAAVVGLSAIIVKSALLFSIFKYAGAIYLAYIGFKTLWSLRSGEVAASVDTNGENKYGKKSCFRQGFLTNLLNPKVAIFFLTFLPQFVDRGSDTFFPFLIMGITYTVLTLFWFILFIYLINQISAFMKKPSTQKVVQGITGIALLGFGLKLALEKSH